MKSGLGNLLNLLFFVIMFSGCKHDDTDVQVIWVNQQAKKIQIPKNLLTGIPKDALANYVHIRLLTNKDSTNILGDFILENDVLFEPLVPFTRGLVYGVFINGRKTNSFTIPLADGHDAPQIIACYPQQDSLPENVLKIYLHFSQPMKEGLSEKYVLLLKNGKDTLTGVFLNLQPELWNEDRTILTLWLDPGRIKRDLQPNLKLGAPLQINEKYELLVSHNWQSVHGLGLQKDFTKLFIATNRDSLSPVTDQWKIHLPKPSTKQTLLIELNEPLDHFLLMECLSILDQNDKPVKGIFQVSDKDKTCFFTPAESWVIGSYTLRIHSKLEDLAGNNLNRVFDRDVTKSKQPETKGFYSREFKIY